MSANDIMAFIKAIFEKDSQAKQNIVNKALVAKFGGGISSVDVATMRDAFNAGKFDKVAAPLCATAAERIARNHPLQPKRGPGRPPKVQPAAAPAPAAAVAVAAPVKRGPGRPRKNPLPVAAAPAPAAAVAAPVKRGPGRPRKNPLPVAAAPAPAAAKPVPAPAAAKPAPAPAAPPKAHHAPAVAPAVKRGPGRPPKAKPLSITAIAAQAAGVTPPARAAVAHESHRGDRRAAHVEHGRRRADRMMIGFDTIPNHLVLAFRDGHVEDFRFKSKADAQDCITGLIRSGLAASSIAYYSRHEYTTQMTVTVTL